ncbi:hypothetical protein Hanom_Chr01g00039641 [Helianthus anomalus]
MPLMRMEQDFHEDFRWCNNGNWRTIRILDPMWINMLQKDIKMLFYNKIYYPVEDMVQAMQYQQAIKVCYAYDIHSGRMWESKWRDLERKEFLKDVKNEESFCFKVQVYEVGSCNRSNSNVVF